MYPNRIGFAVFGELVIECLEIYDDDGGFLDLEFRVDARYMTYNKLCEWLIPNYPTIARLLRALGREKFVQSVLDWDLSDDKTKPAFYRYAARVADLEGWDDQPEMEYY